METSDSTEHFQEYLGSRSLVLYRISFENNFGIYVQKCKWDILSLRMGITCRSTHPADLIHPWGCWGKTREPFPTTGATASTHFESPENLTNLTKFVTCQKLPT